MTFKEHQKNDFDTFINVDEFADLTIVDGVILKAMIQTHTAEKSARVTQSFDGLHGEFVDLFFKTSDYEKKRERIPKFAELVKVWDKSRQIYKRYEVLAARDEMGITHLNLSAYRQNNLRGGAK